MFASTMPGPMPSATNYLANGIASPRRAQAPAAAPQKVSPSVSSPSLVAIPQMSSPKPPENQHQPYHPRQPALPASQPESRPLHSTLNSAAQSWQPINSSLPKTSSVDWSYQNLLVGFWPKLSLHRCMPCYCASLALSVLEIWYTCSASDSIIMWLHLTPEPYQ